MFSRGACNVTPNPISGAVEDKEENASNKVIEGDNHIAGVADAIETNNIRNWKTYQRRNGNRKVRNKAVVI